MTALVISELTAATIEGTGTFDVLMRAVKAHLDGEFKAGRIKGPEYSTVYLGSLDLAMQTSLAFLLQKRKNDLEAQLLEKQIELTTQQILSATAEALNVPKQGLLLDAQQAQVTQQTTNLVAEALNIPKQGLVIDAQKAQLTQQVANLALEGIGITAKTAQLTQQTTNLVTENLSTAAKTAMVNQQTANGVLEGAVLVAQECKLRAEFDLTTAQTLKSNQEIALLAQKVATEKAQTTALGVDDNSVIGKQKLLYAAQTTGFTRDAEQKAAKLLADTWSVRRTTDEATVADGTNLLNDVSVGRAITKLLSGVGA